ncbi:thiamine-phosphate kinase [Tardisphaera miroshnichenkoae]
MKIKEVGERKLIESFMKFVDMPSGVFPPFDDTVAFKIGNELLSFKIDTFVFSTDRPQGLEPYDVGWKAITAVASDMAAKAASPYLFQCSLSLPQDTDEDDAIQMERGLSEAARAYGGALVGGDTGEAKDGVIAVTGIGVHVNDAFIPRKNRLASGDLVAITGSFGYVALGLAAMMGKVKLSEPILSKSIQAFKHPVARLESGLALVGLGAKVSMDSSDGLALTLHELASLNSVDMEITEMPTDEALATFFQNNKIDPLPFLFYGGEEYELVAAFPEHVSRDALRELGFKVIGKVKKPGSGKITYEGKELKGEGYEHFKAEDP